MARPSTVAWCVAFAVAYVAAFASVVVARPFEDDPTQLLTNLASTGAPLLAASGAAWAARSGSGRARWAWALVAAGSLAWAVGQATWTVYEEALGEDVPFPSRADLGYLAFIPLTISGLGLFASKGTPRGVLARMVLDGFIVAASLLFLSWLLVLGPLVDASADATAAELVVGLAYPAGDVLLATAVLTLGTRVGRAAAIPWLLLGGGILAFAVADSGFVILTTSDAYATGSLVDIGWVAGFILVGLAGVVASQRPSETLELETRVSDAGIFLPYLPFCLALVFLSAHVAAGRALGLVPLGALVALGLLVSARQLSALSENARLARGLECANAKLRECETSRVRLLNTITHDLLNPLTPIRLQLHILGQGALNPKQKRSVDVVQRNVELLERLVKDVKDLARLEQGDLPLAPAPVDVRDVVQSALDTYASIASERGIALRAECATSATLVADKGRLMQVVFNLVSNALKFTPHGGEVVIRIALEGEQLRVSVADTGRGLSSDELSRLFRPFSQVHAPHESAEKGTGLGLFISRRIAQQHRGDLTAESAGHKRGSTFVLRLPLPREPA